MNLSPSPHLAPEPSSHKDVIEDVLVLADLVAPFTQFCEFEKGEEFKSTTKLHKNITIEVEHHNFNELEEIFVQESCNDVTKVRPINLEFNVDIFCVEYESFSCRSDEIESLDVDFCAI